MIYNIDRECMELLSIIYLQQNKKDVELYFRGDDKTTNTGINEFQPYEWYF